MVRFCCCCFPSSHPPIDSPFVGPSAPDILVQIHPDDTALRQEALAIAARSFAGTATTAPEGSLDWVLGPEVREKWDDPRRLELMTWLHRLVQQIAFYQGGFILGAKMPGSAEGKLGAALVCTPYPNGSDGGCKSKALFCDIVGLFICPGKNGIKDPSRIYRKFGADDAMYPDAKAKANAKKGIEKRMSAAGDSIEEVRKRVMPPGIPYLHVVVVAVDPSAQGQGLCSKLMRAANGYADERNWACYLETTGERNVEIYKRFGYEIAEEYSLRVPGGDPSGVGEHGEEFGMLRPVGGRKS